MSRHRKDPLRPLTADERKQLTRLSRSLSAPAAKSSEFGERRLCAHGVMPLYTPVGGSWPTWRSRSSACSSAARSMDSIRQPRGDRALV